MSYPQKAQSPGATGQSAHQTADAPIIGHGDGGDKIEAHLIACLTKAGNSVHRLSGGGYLACRFGLSKHCPDVAALAAFARLTGAVK